MMAWIFRRWGGMDWYELFLLLISLVIVYPDVVAEKVFGAFEKVATFSHVVAMGVLGLGGMTVFTVWLVRKYAEFEWWHSLAWLAGVLGFRIIHHFLVSLFD